jgi:2-haloacid dehalogenase
MGSNHGILIRHADLVELEMRSATMPAHPDVQAGLMQLKDAGFRLVTLSNSPHRRADHTAKARRHRWLL